MNRLQQGTRYSYTSNVSNQRGNGIGSILKNAFLATNPITSIPYLASKFASSEIGTKLKNAIPNSDATARPGFAGENHMILKLPNGKNGIANYMGQLGPSDGSKSIASHLL